MFDIGWSELLVIGVVAIVVVGPKELPRLMRTFGHYVGKLLHMTADVQRQFEQIVRDTGIEEVRKMTQESHAEVSDTPLMEPKPAEPPTTLIEAAAETEKGQAEGS